VRSAVTTVFVACVLLGLAWGCASAGKNRRQYVETITSMGCSKYDQCGRIGPGRDFRSLEECNNRMLWRIYDAWPETDCDGRINPARFSACEEKANALGCDGDFAETVAALQECDKQLLCVDTREEKIIYPREFKRTSH